MLTRQQFIGAKTNEPPFILYASKWTSHRDLASELLLRGLLQSSSLVVVWTGGNPTRISRLLYCRAVIKRKVSFINVDEDSQL